MKIIGNRYELKEKLGEGHIGKTYRALDLSNNVIKTLRLFHPSRIHTQGIAEIKLDVQMLSRFKHTHLIKVYDFGYNEQEEPYYTFEYCRGGSIENLTQEIDLKQAATIGVQVLDALYYLHSQGVVHGNLKPSNILLAILPSEVNETRVLLSDHYLSRKP